MSYQTSLEKRALEVLLDTLIAGQKYPRSHGSFITLEWILSEYPDETAEAVMEFLGTKDAYEFEKTIRGIAEKCLIEGPWHDLMIRQLREDDEAQAMELRAEINKEIAA